MAIRNPTQADVEKILASKNEPLQAKPIVKQEVQIEEKKNVILNGEVIKPKKSKFEPDPVKFIVPSGTKFFSNGYLWVRKLNTDEETKLTQLGNANGEKLNATVNTILSNVIKSDIPFSEVPVIDKIPLFNFVIGLTYNDKVYINRLTDCKNCSPDLNWEVAYNAEGTYDTPKNEDIYPFIIKLTSYEQEYTVCFHYPKIKNEDAVNEKEISNAISELVIYLRDNNGIDIPKEDWEEIFAWLNVDDKSKKSECLTSYNKYGTTMKFSCKNCPAPDCNNEYVEVKTEKLFATAMSRLIL